MNPVGSNKPNIDNYLIMKDQIKGNFSVNKYLLYQGCKPLQNIKKLEITDQFRFRVRKGSIILFRFGLS